MSAGAPAVAGLFAAGSLLLAGAGVAKVRRPADSSIALRAAGLPATPGRVRAVAAAETAVGVAALVAPGPVPALLVALSFAGFAVFVAVALRRRLPLASCGCFGRPDTPPSWAHVVVNVVAAGSALAWAFSQSRSLPSTLAGQAWRAVPLAAGSLVVCAMAAIVLTNPLAQARHQGSGDRQ
ncbi:hypothetical protein K6U06_02420 [Acidiferrimicrobium sp. IK]|uniref:MauE/DoxX family redox-associated membrane protein n=1 Tax=Acidiferrimicrobium sp. IK TaxID=2871700 RepID=UPI0021CB424D|nr:MauE/DoxX family redox-associated membrane protein [Acidiferrimicrobium sp. IK]MCU4183200.1 hypothetical protein [Acidiferrimicrobium sp. IK]